MHDIACWLVNVLCILERSLALATDLEDTNKAPSQDSFALDRLSLIHLQITNGPDRINHHVRPTVAGSWTLFT